MHQNTYFNSDKEISDLRQALGLLTTLKPDMLINPNDPIGMAKEIVEFVEETMKKLTEGKLQFTANIVENAERWYPHPDVPEDPFKQIKKNENN